MKELRIKKELLLDIFQLKPIYLCSKSKLYELLITKAEHNNLFGGFNYSPQKEFQFYINGKANKVFIHQTVFIENSFIHAKHENKSNCYDIEIAADISSLIANIEIGTHSVGRFLEDLKGERSKKTFDFAKDKGYVLLPNEITLTSELFDSIDKLMYFQNKKIPLLNVRELKDIDIQKGIGQISDVFINHIKTDELKLRLTFSITQKREDGSVFCIPSKNLFMESINDKVYLKDKKNRLFSDHDYLKTTLILKCKEQINQIKALKGNEIIEENTFSVEL